MATYRKNCPHCKMIVESGGGFPKKSLGKPNKICRFCGNPYLDEDVLDWDNAHWLDKVLYCFANGRFFLCLLAFLCPFALEWKPYLWIVGLGASLLVFALCVLYVKKQVDKYRRRR